MVFFVAQFDQIPVVRALRRVRVGGVIMSVVGCRWTGCRWSFAQATADEQRVQ